MGYSLAASLFPTDGFAHPQRHSAREPSAANQCIEVGDASDTTRVIGVTCCSGKIPNDWRNIDVDQFAVLMKVVSQRQKAVQVLAKFSVGCVTIVYRQTIRRTRCGRTEPVMRALSKGQTEGGCTLSDYGRVPRGLPEVWEALGQWNCPRPAVIFLPVVVAQRPDALWVLYVIVRSAHIPAARVAAKDARQGPKRGYLLHDEDLAHATERVTVARGATTSGTRVREPEA
ncbi:hypothetical protein OBBRIDRAFT_804998 [Obba rivulosa]|uniref:Uncharacterized protein n=1 Tax=Obba rivulosa TaxID=1052685 RepID=A0A8E2AYL9_9APHY|nr:hypothetical protein OBBRIDRAFT_804998 [Obba rivulosa]